MTKKVDIRLLQEAQDIIASLRAKLSGKSFVSHEHYAALQLERDRLAARVGELEHLANAVCYHDNRYGKYPDDVYQFARKALNRSKPASLARHDAEVLRKVATEKSFSQLGVTLLSTRVVLAEADRIEQEADK